MKFLQKHIVLNRLIKLLLCSKLFAGASVFVNAVTEITLALIGKNKVMVTQSAALHADTTLDHFHHLKIEHFLQALNGKILSHTNGIIAVPVDILQNLFCIHLCGIIKLY